MPNPNVMIELGWSLHQPGPGRQIYVLNTAEGWTIKGLPFDIRHRRVLTYSLAADAEPKVRERVRKALVRALSEAIRVNLTEHLEGAAATTPIAGVPAKADEPSLWAGGELGFKHQDSFGHGHWTSAAIPKGARTYLRVIPSGWTSGAPDVASIEALGIDVVPMSPTFATGGDSGVTLKATCERPRYENTKSCKEVYRHGRKLGNRRAPQPRAGRLPTV